MKHETIRSANLEMLQRHRPNLTRRLQDMTYQNDLIVTKDACGLLACDSRGEVIDNVQTEDQLTRDRTETPVWPETLIVYPLGFGYGLHRLRSKDTAVQRWICIEPSHEIFLASLNHEEWWRDILADEAVKLFIGDGAEASFWLWADQHRILFSSPLAVVAGRRVRPSERTSMNSFLDRTRSFVETVRQEVASVQEELDRYYSSPRGQKRFIVVEPDHVELASAIVRGMQSGDWTAVLSHQGQRFHPILGKHRDLLYLYYDRPDAILLIHNNPLSENTNLFDRYHVPRILWYIDHPAAVQPISGNPGNLSEILIFDDRYHALLRSYGYRNIATLAIGACLPFCEGFGEVMKESGGDGDAVTFLGGLAGGQYQLCRQRWKQESPERLMRLDDCVECLTDLNQPDDWVVEPRSVPYLAGEEIEDNPSTLLYLLQGVSYRRRLRFLSALVPFELKLFGRDWEKHELSGKLADCRAGGLIPYGCDVARLYRRSAININIMDAMMVDSINIRSFDVMAAGGFLLTEYRPIVDRTFIVGEECDCFRSTEELIEKVRFYLAHPHLRQEIARRGQERVLRDHTIANRWNTLVDWSAT